MEADFWHERWALGEIGFHRSSVHWALQAHWSHRFTKAHSVLVPLCGKSLDMHWLLRQGVLVTGIDLSELAIEGFFREIEIHLEPTRVVDSPVPGAITYQAGSIQLICADFLKLTPDHPFDAFYDRAALIALPPDMRVDYLQHLATWLKPGSIGLVVTFEYEEKQMLGPPFSVCYEELTAHPAFQVQCLERRDVLAEHPGMRSKGLTALTECVYCLTKD